MNNYLMLNPATMLAHVVIAVTAEEAVRLYRLQLMDWDDFERADATLAVKRLVRRPPGAPHSRVMDVVDEGTFRVTDEGVAANLPVVERNIHQLMHDAHPAL